MIVALGIAAGRCRPSPPHDQPVLVFAAVSLTEALDEAVAAARPELSIETRISYAGSSALARQIEAGAPADLFMSADTAWMDYLDERGLIRTDTRVDLLGNALVVVGPAAEHRSTPQGNAAGVIRAHGTGRLAVADTTAVPAGRYAKAALEHLGLWQEVQPRLVQTEHVRAALRLVSRGDASLGIVYRTDALADPSVALLGTFPPSSHPPIVYPAAVTARAPHPRAADLLSWLRGRAARTIFERHGFSLPPVP